jgi:glutaconyl-CoA/methylmalonyl-CoA decarboxylase subunit gamma
MERYTVTVGEQRFVVGVEDAGTDRFRVHVDGRQLEVHLEATAHAGPEHHAHPAPVAGLQAATPARGAQGGAAAAPPGAVLAPMPGTVLKILVGVGAHVARGDVLVHLEAMKMTNAVRAPHDGSVAEVLVHDGEQVAYGATLVRLVNA